MMSAHISEEDAYHHAHILCVFSNGQKGILGSMQKERILQRSFLGTLHKRHRRSRNKTKCILCLASRTTVMSVRIPKVDAYHRMFSHRFKK